MANRLQTAAARLFARLAGRAGRTVTYWRLTQSSGPLTAVLNLQTYEVVDDLTGLPDSVIISDWTLPLLDLLVDGDLLEPREGDRISEQLGSETIEYEVVPLGKRPAAEWMDTAGTLWLIHTKRIDRCPTPS